MKRNFFLLMALTFAVSWLSAITVQGTVTDIDTGEAVSGATVRFVLIGECESDRNGNGNGNHNGNGNGNGYNALTALTDENGNYLIEDVAAGIYNGIGRKPGEYTSSHIDGIEITEDISVDFELTPGNCEPPSRKYSGFRFQNN